MSGTSSKLVLLASMISGNVMLALAIHPLVVHAGGSDPSQLISQTSPRSFTLEAEAPHTGDAPLHGHGHDRFAQAADTSPAQGEVGRTRSRHVHDAAYAELRQRSTKDPRPSNRRKLDLSEYLLPEQQAGLRPPRSHASHVPLRAATARRVVVVSMDGLRPDAISPRTKHLHQMVRTGVRAMRARTIAKSTTLPSHASMVSGYLPAEHGIRFNSLRPRRGRIKRPTMFSSVREAGMPSALFVAKKKLIHILDAADDHRFHNAGIFCQKVVDRAVPYLRRVDSGIVFVHFADPDSAGHRHGWMSPEYLRAVRRSDRCLGRLRDTISAGKNAHETLLIVTSDHGGHGRGHGTRMEADARIPWIATGAGSAPGRGVKRRVSTLDTAATALSALGVPLAPDMQGRPILETLGPVAAPRGLPLVGAPLRSP